MNKKFTNPEMDIQEFVKRFENENRDVYTKREEISRTIGLRPGDSVTSIGAGTGLYTFLFAEQVGLKGTVYAVDIGRNSSSTSTNEPSGRVAGKSSRPSWIPRTSRSCRPGEPWMSPSCNASITSSIPRNCWNRSTATITDGRLVIIDFDLHRDGWASY